MFDVVTFEQAKHTVLTSDPDNPKKLQQETEYVVEKMADNLNIKETDVVLDFGCGMGRISKKMIETFNCSVLGIDISDSMKTFAKLYVASPNKFKTISEMPESNSVDVCLTIFVLQHTEHPVQEIENIVNVLKPNGHLIIVNEDARYVPSDIDPNGFIVWEDDKLNVFTEIEKHLTKVKEISYCNTSKNIVIYKKEST